jgi:hypothetical protein
MPVGAMMRALCSAIALPCAEGCFTRFSERSFAEKKHASVYSGGIHYVLVPLFCVPRERSFVNERDVNNRIRTCEHAGDLHCGWFLLDDVDRDAAR